MTGDTLPLERARLTGALTRLAEQIRAINAGVAADGSPRVRALIADDYRRAAGMVELVIGVLALSVQKVGAVAEFEAALARLNTAIDKFEDGQGGA